MRTFSVNKILIVQIIQLKLDTLNLNTSTGSSSRLITTGYLFGMWNAELYGSSKITTSSLSCCLRYNMNYLLMLDDSQVL